MIDSLKIKELFGRFNYDFCTKDGGVTIVTGPNGYGKSTILQIVDAISNKRIRFFLGLEFKSIECSFDGGYSVKIEKSDNGISLDGNLLSEEMIERLEYSRRRPPYFRRISPNEWIDQRNDRIISTDEMRFFSIENIDLDEIIEIVDMGDNKNDRLSGIVTILNNMSNWSGKTRLISDQRLIRRSYTRVRDEKEITEVVLELPDELKKKISNVSSDYSTQANKLDSTYPSRLLKSTKDDEIGEDEYKRRLKEAQDKFGKLKMYKLAEAFEPILKIV